MYINYIILRLLLPFLCIAVYCADAQGFVNFPAGTTISTPNTIVSTDKNEIEVDLIMNGATTTKANQTRCTGFNLAANDLFFIFQFAGHADYSLVHHMGLYACSITPANSACQCPMPNRSPLFSWARNTPPVRFTGSGTSTFGVFRVGQGTDRNFLFVETHYHHPVTTPDRTSGIKIRITRNLNTTPPGGPYYELAIYSFMGTGTIPANSPSYTIDTCMSSSNRPSSWDGSYLEMVGFQSHTHNLGRVVSTFRSTNNNAPTASSEVATGNPLWPNSYNSRYTSFSNTNNFFSRCVYTSTGVANDTNTNGKFASPTAWHEMCVQSVIWARQRPLMTQWSSTTPAFLTGKCTPAQSTAMNAFMPTAFPTNTPSAAGSDALYAHANYGNGTGSYTYRSAKNNNFRINLDLQTFTDLFN